MTVVVSFDHTCDYSDRARHWLDALEHAEIDRRPSSLLEHSGGDGTSVFDQPQHAENPSLIALAVHEQVRAQGGDLHAYRRRMFAAWHEEPGRLSTQDIVDLERDAGLRDFDRDAGFSAGAALHARAAGLGVFGTPTLVPGPERVVFVELDALPTIDRARPLREAVGQLAASGQDLRQWQRVTAPDEIE